MLGEYRTEHKECEAFEAIPARLWSGEAQDRKVALLSVMTLVPSLYRGLDKKLRHSMTQILLSTDSKGSPTSGKL